MDAEPLTADDVAFLLESLKYTKRTLEGTQYPTEELRQEHLATVDSMARKLRALDGR